MNNDEIVQLLLQVTGAKDLDDLKEKAQGAKDKLEDLAGATSKAEKSTRDFGRSVLEGGRFLQDFAQGGIGGVLNNIEGLATALGGGPGLAGLMTGVGLAAFFAIPRIKSFWSALVDGSNDVPRSTDRLGGLSDALKTVTDRLKDLREKGSLTDAELKEFNESLEKRLGLEKQITAEKQQQATFDKARKAADAGVLDEESAAQAQYVVNDVMGGVDRAVSGVATELFVRSRNRGGRIAKYDQHVSAIEERRRRATERGEENILAKGDLGQMFLVPREQYFDQLQAQARKEFDDAVEEIRKEARSLVENALKGDMDASSRVAMLNVGGTMREWLQATRGGKALRERDEAESEAFADRARAGSRARAAARKEAELDAKAEEVARKFEGETNDRWVKYQDDARDAEKKARAKKNEEVRRLEDENRDFAHEIDVDQARENAPDARLRRMREQARRTAAGVVQRENPGDLSIGQLNQIVNDAAENTPSLDVDVIRQYVYRATQLVRAKMEQDMYRQLGRQTDGSDPNYGYIN